jgi:hypothetical protein
MTKRLTIAVFSILPGLCAQPAITPPQLGFVEDSACLLRPAYGIGGNFILGPAVSGKIVTAAFSGSFAC